MDYAICSGVSYFDLFVYCCNVCVIVTLSRESLLLIISLMFIHCIYLCVSCLYFPTSHYLRDVLSLLSISRQKEVFMGKKGRRMYELIHIVTIVIVCAICQRCNEKKIIHLIAFKMEVRNTIETLNY